MGFNQVLSAAQALNNSAMNVKTSTNFTYLNQQVSQAQQVVGMRTQLDLNISAESSTLSQLHAVSTLPAAVNANSAVIAAIASQNSSKVTLWNTVNTVVQENATLFTNGSLASLKSQTDALVASNQVLNNTLTSLLSQWNLLLQQWNSTQSKKQISPTTARSRYEQHCGSSSASVPTQRRIGATNKDQ